MLEHSPPVHLVGPADPGIRAVPAALQVLNVEPLGSSDVALLAAALQPVTSGLLDVELGEGLRLLAGAAALVLEGGVWVVHEGCSSSSGRGWAPPYAEENEARNEV